MSLFGTSPPSRDESPAVASPARGDPSRSGLFDEPEAPQRAPSASLFADDLDSGDGADTPWGLPSPRKQQTRADVVRNLLPSSDVPDSYVEYFDAILQRDSAGGNTVTSDGISQVFTAAELYDPSVRSRIVDLVAPGDSSQARLGRGEFNVLMALIGLVQEGEEVSLDGVDERRKSKSYCAPCFALIFCLSSDMASFCFLPQPLYCCHCVLVRRIYQWHHAPQSIAPTRRWRLDWFPQLSLSNQAPNSQASGDLAVATAANHHSDFFSRSTAAQALRPHHQVRHSSPRGARREAAPDAGQGHAAGQASESPRPLQLPDPRRAARHGRPRGRPLEHTRCAQEP